MALTQELIELYNNNKYNINRIETLELINPYFSQTWYIVKSKESFVGKLENGTTVTYIPSYFEFVLPENTAKGQQNASFNIDATDEIVLNDFFNFIDNSDEPIILNYREYLSNSQEIQSSLLNIKLLDVKLDYNLVSGTASRPDINNMPFPYDRYDDRFKGLKYV